MTESDHTGYGESPDTTDGPVAEDQTGGGESAGSPETTLTTDDDAQRDDSITRPGNEPD